MAELLRPMLLVLLVLMGLFTLCPNVGMCDTDPLDCGADDEENLIGVAPVTDATVCFASDREALL